MLTLVDRREHPGGKYTRTKGAATSPSVSADWPGARRSPGSALREITIPATGAVSRRSCATAFAEVSAARAFATSARAA
jgi:hypothetical protein